MTLYIRLYIQLLVFNKVLKLVAIVALVLMPISASAHRLSPRYETIIAVTETVYKDYKLTNAKPHPSVYEVQVLNEDFTPAEDWKAKKTIYKMLPNSVKEIKLKFKADRNRKLLVCTTLKEIGKNNEKAFNSSRVCSRLLILSPS